MNPKALQSSVKNQSRILAKPPKQRISLPQVFPIQAHDHVAAVFSLYISTIGVFSQLRLLFPITGVAPENHTAEGYRRKRVQETKYNTKIEHKKLEMKDRNT